MSKNRKYLALSLSLICGIAFGDGSESAPFKLGSGGTTESKKTAPAGPRELEFYASDKAAQFQYKRDSSIVSVNEGHVVIGFLFDEERDNVFTGSLVVDSTATYLPGVSLAVGGKVYAALLGLENNDVFGLGLGIEASYALPVKQFPLQLDASFYYAPDILTFGQSDRIFDWQVNVGLPIRKSLIGFVGFRYLEFDTRPGSQKLDNEVHVGIRWLTEG